MSKPSLSLNEQLKSSELRRLSTSRTASSQRLAASSLSQSSQSFAQISSQGESNKTAHYPSSPPASAVTTSRTDNRSDTNYSFVSSQDVFVPSTCPDEQQKPQQAQNQHLTSRVQQLLPPPSASPKLQSTTHRGSLLSAHKETITKNQIQPRLQATTSAPVLDEKNEDDSDPLVNVIPKVVSESEDDDALLPDDSNGAFMSPELEVSDNAESGLEESSTQK